MDSLSNSELLKKAKEKKIPLYTKFTRKQLISALSKKEGSIGWRWSYIKPHIQPSEYKDVMRLLISPIRDITRYRKVTDYLREHSVHTTMTTSPKRLKKLGAVLATLDTSYVEHINIVLPYLYGRDKKPYNKKDIEKISKFPKVRIIRTEKDYGPITKMLPVLNKVNDPKSIVISIDDDVGYPIGLINELIYQKIENHPNSIVESTVSNIDLRQWIERYDTVWPSKQRPRTPYVDLVEGWMGVAYTKGLVETKTMEKISKLSKECFLSDDIVISYVLTENKVPIVRVNNKYTPVPFSYMYGTEDDALMRGGGTGDVVDVPRLSDAYNLQKYEKCLDSIQAEKDPSYVPLPLEDSKAIEKSKKRPVRDLTPSEIEHIKKHKVYITLTSDPDRLKLLPLMLENLDTTHVHEIHVNLPKKYRNEVSYNNDEIKRLKQVNKVKVYRVAKDIGPITKVLPTLKRVKDKEAIIISIDDDIVYPRGMVNEHIHTCIKHMDDITTGSGFNFDNFGQTKSRQGFKVKQMAKWWPSAKSPAFPYVDIAEGFGSIGYRKRLVNIKQLEKLNSTSKHCKLSDDFTINYSLESNGVMRRCIDNAYLNLDLIHPLVMGEQKGLHVQKPPGKYWDYNTYKYVECSADIKKAN